MAQSISERVDLGLQKTHSGQRAAIEALMRKDSKLKIRFAKDID